MKKEILTVQNIQSDLRYLLRGKVFLTVACAILAALAIFDLFWIPQGTSAPQSDILKIAFLGIAFLIVAIVEGRAVLNLYSALNNPGRIVTDRLIAKEEKFKMRGRGLAARHSPSYHLRFASYGEHEIPAINRRWNSQHDMTARWVHFHAECDDEFYLVLSKGYTGKILLAYNTKMFDYQQPQP